MIPHQRIAQLKSKEHSALFLLKELIKQSTSIESTEVFVGIFFLSNWNGISP